MSKKNSILIISAAVILLSFLAATHPAFGKTTILCSSPGSSDVVISINSAQYSGFVLSCVRGNFISDMTPCAPENGYGLSAPTGDARLVGVVRDWHDPAYTTHSGGVIRFSADTSRYQFVGGFMWPSKGLEENWRFEVNRLSGSATLAQRGKASQNYSCKKAQPKF